MSHTQIAHRIIECCAGNEEVAGTPALDVVFGVARLRHVAAAGRDENPVMPCALKGRSELIVPGTAVRLKLEAPPRIFNVVEHRGHRRVGPQLIRAMGDVDALEIRDAALEVK